MNALATATVKQTAFCIFVWWMHGWSKAKIAKITGLTGKAIERRLARRFLTPRGELSDESRQLLLDELKAKREDGGILGEDAFKILPLVRSQLKTKRTNLHLSLLRANSGAKLVDQPAKLDRRSARRAKKAEEDRKRLDEKGRAPRLLAPFEHLCSRGYLTDEGDRGSLKDIGSSGRRRQEAGLKLRAYIDGTKISGLKAIDYEGASGGGSTALPPSAHRFFSVDTMERLRGLMTDADMTRLEQVVARDEYIWEKIRVRVNGLSRAEQPKEWQKAHDKAVSKTRELLFEDIRRSLDIVAVYEGLLTREGFRDRWGYSLPIPRKAARSDAVDRSQQAADLLSAGRRT